MASPFRHFRKHSKAFMAAAAVMCMFLFVFASGTGGGPSRDGAREAGAKVASWKGGSINQQELASYVNNRLLTNELLQRLFVQGGGQDPAYDLPPGLTELMLQSRQREYVEMDAIAIEVISQLATQAGMTVSDDMINTVLELFAQKNVSADEMQGIFASLGGGDERTNETVVFNTLRKVLLSYFYRQAYQDAGRVVLPQERWQDWRRVNERISLQAAVLPVESFEKDLPAEPTEVQLQSLYNEFKDVEPHVWVTEDGRDMPSSTPGFSEPRRVRLQFLLANVADRTEKHLDKVTGAEIADYYERNKRSEFVKMDFGAEEEAPDEEPAAEGAADEAPAGETPAAEAPAEDEAKPASEAEAASAPESQPATPATEAPPAAESAPATETAPAADEAPKPEGKEGASLPPRANSFRLAAYQPTPDAESVPVADVNAAESATETPADEGKTEAAPEADGGTPASDSDEGPADDKPAEDKPADDKAEDIVEYERLEKVSDDIRRTLARDKAVAELEEIMSEAAAELQAEYNAYGSRLIAAKEAKRPAPAASEKLTDLKWLADKYGLSYDKTALLTARELFDTAVGKAADVARGATSVTGAAFTTLAPYEPFLAKELEGDWYLAIKTEDVAPHVPEFTKVRDKVIAEWKRREAANLAEKRAKELAEEAKKSGQSFEEFFKSKGYEVIPQTELFSWRTTPVDPMSGYPPVLSEVPKLKYVGPEFMQTAFGLGDGDVAGVLNFDHSNAYVIKLHSRQYPENELKELFLEEDRFWPGQIGTRRQRQQAFAAAVDKEILKDRAALEFDEEWQAMRAEQAQQQ